MRGHSQGGHKHGDGVNQQEHFGHHHVYGTKEWLHKRELQKLKQKVEQLAEQNKALKKELEKNTGSH
jgi:cell division protein FtsB